MYVPSHYAEADLPTLFDFIEQHLFGLLISRQDGVPVATHLPFLLDRTAGERGVLSAHVAKQNPQWKDFADQQVLAVFHGPHAYVSPAWYEAEKVVPTWNYVAVHAYGRVKLIDDLDETIALVRELTDRFERSRPKPWTFDPSAAFVRKMASQIVAFRIGIERIEGKWKLNQNHPEERRRRVIDRLRQQGNEDSEAIASLMAGMLAGTKDRVRRLPPGPQGDIGDAS
jgi:transcriptional regulator